LPASPLPDTEGSTGELAFERAAELGRRHIEPGEQAGSETFGLSEQRGEQVLDVGFVVAALDGQLLRRGESLLRLLGQAIQVHGQSLSRGRKSVPSRSVS
jgi:hypothetical protein